MADRILNLKARQKQIYLTAQEWVSKNPILLAGELGVESDTEQLKIGDGIHTWKELEYLNSVAFFGENFIAYKDGKLTQWGKVEIKNCAITITFAYPFLDTSYSIMPTLEGATFLTFCNASLTIDESSRETTKCCVGAKFGGSATVNWRAEGKWK